MLSLTRGVTAIVFGLPLATREFLVVFALLKMRRFAFGMNAFATNFLALYFGIAVFHKFIIYYLERFVKDFLHLLK